MHRRLDLIDERISRWMLRHGHGAHRLTLGLLFVWFGGLKVLGHASGSSLIAHVVYLGSPAQTVPLLGLWEVVIGVCLLHRGLIRVALLLLAIRLPGTLLALVVKADVCFAGSPLVPTPEGQYLIKDAVLFAAAMVIGGTVREEEAAAGAGPPGAGDGDGTGSAA